MQAQVSRGQREITKGDRKHRPGCTGKAARIDRTLVRRTLECLFVPGRGSVHGYRECLHRYSRLPD